jgi:pimeloyl-ACP methyl ester carboxylesterase
MRWIAAAGLVLAAVDGFAPVPGARLFYTDSGGSGVPIVLMHAATGSVRAWEHQTPAFTRAGFRVIAFDRRGWGRTTSEPGAASGTAADDLIALMDYLHVDRFHLVGTAAGGFVTFDTALSYPARLRSIVVANSIGGVQDEEFLALGRRIRPPEFTAMPAELREVSPSYRAGNPEGTRRWVELEKVSRRRSGCRRAALKNRITFAGLERITVPVLLLTGDADMSRRRPC